MMERESEKEKERVLRRVSVSHGLAALASLRPGWAESKTANSQQYSQHMHQLEASQMLVQYKKCNASSRNPQAAALKTSP